MKSFNIISILAFVSIASFAHGGQQSSSTIPIPNSTSNSNSNSNSNSTSTDQTSSFPIIKYDPQTEIKILKNEVFKLKNLLENSKKEVAGLKIQNSKLQEIVKRLEVQNSSTQSDKFNIALLQEVKKRPHLACDPIVKDYVNSVLTTLKKKSAVSKVVFPNSNEIMMVDSTIHELYSIVNTVNTSQRCLIVTKSKN